MRGVGGIARAGIVLTVVAGAADAVGDVSLAAANERLVVRWTAPTSAELGGGALLGYRVRWAEGSGSTSWVDADGVSTGGTDAFYTIPGLTNGTVYAVQAAAVNSAGTGAWSTSAEGTPAAVLAFASPQSDLIVLADSPFGQSGDSPRGGARFCALHLLGVWPCLRVWLLTRPPVRCPALLRLGWMRRSRTRCATGWGPRRSRSFPSVR